MFFRKKNINSSLKSNEQDFWSWFEKSKLLESQGLELLKKLSPKLKKIHETLVAEVGPVGQNPRELILSCDGIKEGVEHVDRLADSAPDLPHWKITRFRPPLPNYERLGIRFGDSERSPENLKFILHESGSLFDIEIFADWCEESGPPDGATFILLDMAIGEYNVMCRLGGISLHPVTSSPEQAKSWDQLQSIFV